MYHLRQPVDDDKDQIVVTVASLIYRYGRSRHQIYCQLILTMSCSSCLQSPTRHLSWLRTAVGGGWTYLWNSQNKIAVFNLQRTRNDIRIINGRSGFVETECRWCNQNRVFSWSAFGANNEVDDICRPHSQAYIAHVW